MFMQWILTQTERDDPIGDLANDFKNDKTRPDNRAGIDKIRRYLWLHHASSEAMEAFQDAVREYKENGVK